MDNYVDKMWKLFYDFTACRFDILRTLDYCWLYKERKTKMTKHTFSDWLDEDCYRCEDCGMNVLGTHSTCEEFIAYRDERNRKFRERMGLVTNS